MILIIGLGNPGKKYQKTRHNIGFRIIDEFQKENNFPEFKLSKKFNSLISENILYDKKIILAKPQTFMNNSGKAVKIMIDNLSLITKTAKTFLTPEAKKIAKGLIIIHDDIDLTFGKIKISENRGSAGHKGVQSIIDTLKTKNFIRFRIGIKQIKAEQKTIPTERFVLQKFTKQEEQTLKQIIKKTCEGIKIRITE